MKQTTKKDFRFDHKKYKSKSVNVGMIDSLMNDFISVGTSKIAAIFIGLKICLFFFYLWARKSLIDTEFMIAKQEYEQGRTNSNEDSISQDELD